MISEKEMMIVDAVNYLEARSAKSAETTVWASSHPYYFAFGRVVSNGTVCSVERYNQCIREMSEGAFVPDANPEFVYGQDVYVEDPLFSNKELKFGCLTLKGDCAILLTGGGHMVYPLVGISSKPLKTKEEIELEEAEKARNEKLFRSFSHFYKSDSAARHAIQLMSDDGHLAGIILPLESK